VDPDCPHATELDWHLCCPEAKACLPLTPVGAAQGVWDSAKKELFNGVFSSLEGSFPQKKV